MKIFAFWTGGMDSTAMILRLLAAGHEVHAGYVEIMNNPEKTKRERAAIQNLLPKIQERYPEFVLVERVAKTECSVGPVHYPSFKQLPSFVFAAVQYAGGYDQIALGYVMNDDEISFLSEIRELFETSFRLTIQSDIKIPEIIFPMTKTSKHEIHNDLGELFEFVTWCEEENLPEGHRNCGECTPCRKMIALRLSVKDQVKEPETESISVDPDQSEDNEVEAVRDWRPFDLARLLQGPDDDWPGYPLVKGIGPLKDHIFTWSILEYRDRVFLIGGSSGGSFVRTSPIQQCWKIPDGRKFVSTLNSTYELGYYDPGKVERMFAHELDHYRTVVFPEWDRSDD